MVLQLTQQWICLIHSTAVPRGAVLSLMAMGCCALCFLHTLSVTRCVNVLCRPAGSYEYIRRFIVEVSGAEKGHGPDAPSALPVYDLLAGSASGGLTCISLQAVL